MKGVLAFLLLVSGHAFANSNYLCTVDSVASCICKASMIVKCVGDSTTVQGHIKNEVLVKASLEIRNSDDKVMGTLLVTGGQYKVKSLYVLRDITVDHPELVDAVKKELRYYSQAEIQDVLENGSLTLNTFVIDSSTPLYKDADATEVIETPST